MLTGEAMEKHERYYSQHSIADRDRLVIFLKIVIVCCFYNSDVNIFPELLNLKNTISE